MNMHRNQVLPSEMPVDEQSAEKPFDEQSYNLCVSHVLFSRKWYVQQYPDTRSSSDPVADYLLLGGFEGRDPHPLFDSDWYLAQNPDVAAAGINPLVHYLKQGAQEGRDPHPLFDSDWYLAQNPDVAAAGINPLVHYLEQGAQEGRDPHPLFDSDWYLTQNPDVAAAGIDPLIHYLEQGAQEGRDPHPLFDSDWYLTHNPDVAAAGVNPLVHYMAHGAKQGRDPHPLFDSDWYLAQNPDVAATGVNPLVHYLARGAQEGHDPHPLFDSDWYLAQNPDVAAAGINPLVHYLAHGAQEGRDPHPLFDSDWYLVQNPDAAAAGINPLVHYLTHGAQRGRNPSPRFDTGFYRWKYQEAAQTDRNPLVHFVTEGRARGYSPIPSANAGPVKDMVPVRHEPWSAPNGPEWVASFRHRLKERMNVLGTMDLTRPLPGDRPTFSLTTAVYDTKPSFLKELAQTIREQAFEDFEWLILDNGSTSPSTIDIVRDIAASDERFNLFRVEDGLHIIGGSRYLLERAAGHFIVPIDHDDLLYPDSLALFANVLRESKGELPCLIYSDEQKVTKDGQPFELIWRWDFTFAHAMATVPAAHLMAFSTELAREVGVYADDYARGSPDWDAALRITERGGLTEHIPEVLYGWRMHELSTALAAGAKDYIGNSQKEVLNNSLKRRALDDLFQFELLFDSLGWYHPVRKHREAPRIEIDFVVGALPRELANLRHNLAITADMPAGRRVFYPSFLRKQVGELSSRYDHLKVEWAPYSSEAEICAKVNEVETDIFAKVIVASNLRIRDASAIWDAIGVLELDRGAGAVCGPVVGTNEIMLNAGLLSGVGGFVGSPFYGWVKNEIPEHLLRPMHKVTAAPTFFLAIRAEVLSEIGGISGIDVDDAIYGLDFARRCAEVGYAIVYTQKMECERDEVLARSVGEGSVVRAKMRVHGLPEQLKRARFSSHLSLNPNRFGSLKRPQDTAVLAGFDCSPLNPAIPLNLCIDPDLESSPTINLLLPAVRMSSMSGGPNTALNLVYRLALAGFPVRIISTDVPAPDSDIKPVLQHMMALADTNELLAHVEIVSGADRSKPLPIGANDIFMATAWWTAQMAKHAAKFVDERPFIYLTQDFEPLFYPASSHYAQALETYGLNHIPVINTGLLKDYLSNHKIGKYAEPSFASAAIDFEPAVSDKAFYFEEKEEQPKRRLLFYARPGHPRNLFYIGVYALRAVIANGVLSPLNWTFLGMGEQFEPEDLGHGAILECAPWLGFEDYARQMRQSDILLSLMLSPHPSYPPLEMAACGGLVVTNSFANKTAERMAAISNNIIAAEPTIEGISEALQQAVARLDDLQARQANARLNLPATWDESFKEVLPAVTERLIELGLRRDAAEQHLRRLKMPGDEQAADPFMSFLTEALNKRSRLHATRQEAGLLSFVSTVWNTAPEFLEILARSVREQLGGTNFEWFVLDNGSTRAETLAFLERLGEEDFVRLERVEKNLGIVGGMRYCLERASGRYIMPLDSDDYIFPDTVQVITWHLQKNNYPALLYSDETLLSGTNLLQPYMKPDWDPVLFVNSCYIAHLGAIDRGLALDYGAYTDRRTDGSHDWDTFTRFFNSGHVPVHIPEVLYAWRIHEQSTTKNIDSKPYVFDSQKAVLSRFLEGQPVRALFDLQKSPLFGQTPDWWLRRRRVAPTPLTTILVRSAVDGGRTPNLHLSRDVDHRLVEVDLRDGLASLLPHVRNCATEGRLVHILASETQPDDDEWFWEAIGLLDLFPDTVMVGGRIHSYGTILSASFFFGFGEGCDCPDRGRPLSDPGYFCQLRKPHSVSAVSAQHALVRPEFLLEVIESTVRSAPSIARLGRWCGAVARTRGQRVIYSPFLSAETTIDWDGYASREETGRFVSAFADLMPERRLLSPNLGLTPATAYTPTHRDAFNPAALGVALPPYQSWFEQWMKTRASLYPLVTTGPSFAILTPLYSGSDPRLFELTAQSVLAQTYPNFQWCMLAQGPITPALDAILRRLERNPKMRVLRLPKNLGIIAGTHNALERSQGEYVVPLDGDDLLAADCLQILAATINGLEKPPVYIYTDEDIVIGEQLQNPFLRPSWDPVLDLENSWVWHVTAFRRDIALEVGAYTDQGCEYCHDWDTLYRFTHAGYQPVHVPEITYHWRHHPASTSNSANPNQGSSKSVQHLLSKKIADRGLSAVCEVAPFPIFRGAEEWWVHRKPIDLPVIRRVIIGTEADNAQEPAPVTYADTLMVSSAGGGLEALQDAIGDLADTSIVMLVSQHLCLAGMEWLTEVVKLFEFHDDVAVVSGRLLSGDRVVATGLMLDGEGRLEACYDGKTVNDAGHFALAWKPQCITVPILDLCFVRAGMLKEALNQRPTNCTFEELSIWLGAFAHQKRYRIAFSPLVAGEIQGPVLRPRNQRIDAICWEYFKQDTAARVSSTPSKTIRCGAAGYARAKFAG
jgi:glycosyltransferase involved in cell wall biosynthesis